MSSLRLQIAGLLLPVVLAAGCAGDGSELIQDVMDGGGAECGDGILDPGEECDDGNTIDGDNCSAACADETATLAYIQATIFSSTCAPCHRPGGIGPFRLDTEAAACQDLVNVQSFLPGLVRVKPGDPESSYLIWKLEGRPGIIGSQMPLFGTPLEQDEIDSIALWIANGALPCP
jgi:cysteine-rich repeat protein